MQQSVPAHPTAGVLVLTHQCRERVTLNHPDHSQGAEYVEREPAARGCRLRYGKRRRGSDRLQRCICRLRQLWFRHTQHGAQRPMTFRCQPCDQLARACCSGNRALHVARCAVSPVRNSPVPSAQSAAIGST